MFSSLTVVVKVSLLVPGLWETRSSMFLSLLTAGVDNITQTGVFGIKVTSTRAKVTQPMGATWKLKTHNSLQKNGAKSIFKTSHEPKDQLFE